MEKVRVLIKETFKGLTFREDIHKYYLDGVPFRKSVSGVIEDFYVPFDTINASAGTARKTGKTQIEVIEEWEQINKIACDSGTLVHLFGEKYVFDRTLKPTGPKEKAIVKFWNSLPDHIVPCAMEAQMYHKEFGFPGTADILLYNTKTKKYIIVDYKTNKTLFNNYKGKKMLAPFNTWLDDNLHHYVIQLSLYQMLFEQVPGIEIEKRKILYLKEDSDFELYDTQDCTEVLTKYLKKNPLW